MPPVTVAMEIVVMTTEYQMLLFSVSPPLLCLTSTLRLHLLLAL